MLNEDSNWVKLEVIFSLNTLSILASINMVFNQTSVDAERLCRVYHVPSGASLLTIFHWSLLHPLIEWWAGQAELALLTDGSLGCRWPTLIWLIRFVSHLTDFEKMYIIWKNMLNAGQLHRNVLASFACMQMTLKHFSDCLFYFCSTCADAWSRNKINGC